MTSRDAAQTFWIHTSRKSVCARWKQRRVKLLEFRERVAGRTVWELVRSQITIITGAPQKLCMCVCYIRACVFHVYCKVIMKGISKFSLALLFGGPAGGGRQAGERNWFSVGATKCTALPPSQKLGRASVMIEKSTLGRARKVHVRSATRRPRSVANARA